MCGGPGDRILARVLDAVLVRVVPKPTRYLHRCRVADRLDVAEVRALAE